MTGFPSCGPELWRVRTERSESVPARCFRLPAARSAATGAPRRCRRPCAGKSAAIARRSRLAIAARNRRTVGCSRPVVRAEHSLASAGRLLEPGPGSVACSTGERGAPCCSESTLRNRTDRAGYLGRFSATVDQAARGSPGCRQAACIHGSAGLDSGNQERAFRYRPVCGCYPWQTPPLAMGIS